MANFHIYGSAEMSDLFKELANTPDDVKMDMLVAMGDATRDALRKTARSAGVEDTGALIESVTRAKPVVTREGGNVMVEFKGSRTDAKHKKPTRNAEIAFVQEYGSSHNRGTGFISNAVVRYGKNIIASGEEIYREWQDKKIN